MKRMAQKIRRQAGRLGSDDGNPKDEKLTMELVLDASIVVRWFLKESLAEKALEYCRQHLLGRIRLAATPLLS